MPLGGGKGKKREGRRGKVPRRIEIRPLHLTAREKKKGGPCVRESPRKAGEEATQKEGEKKRERVVDRYGLGEKGGGHALLRGSGKKESA